MLGVAISKCYRAHRVSGKQARRTRLETMVEEGEVEWEKVGEEEEIIMGEGNGVVMSGGERWEKGRGRWVE